MYSRFEQFGKPGVINPDVQRQCIEALLTSNKPPVENCLRPEFIRLAPPLHIAEDEVLTKHAGFLPQTYKNAYYL